MNNDLIKILRNATLHNEEGSMVWDFEPEHRDAADFMSVSRSQLKAMLEEAYQAGRNA